MLNGKTDRRLFAVVSLWFGVGKTNCSQDILKRKKIWKMRRSFHDSYSVKKLNPSVLSPRSHVSGYFLNFFFPDTATIHTHPANSTANPDILKFALQSGKNLNPQRIR